MTNLLLPALLACCGAWFGFANPLAHVPPLALLLPLGLTLAANGAPGPKAAFRRGLLMGAAACAGALYWMALPVHDYGGLPWILAAPCPVLVGLALGVYLGLFCLGLYLVRGRLSWPLGAVWAGASWWALEYFKGTLFTGFPWLVLASAFSPWPQALQGAALIGAYGLSGVLAASAWLLASGKGLMPAPRIAGALVLAGLAAYGGYALNRPLEQCGTASVALVQGDIDQSLKWDQTYRLGTVQRYKTLSRKAAEDGTPGLLVWPETALPFYLQEVNSLTVDVRRLARELGTSIITGSPAYTYLPEEKRYELHNRAYLVDETAILAGHYDKEHLVPFGEYVPLGQWLGFLGKLVQGVGDFVPGDDTGPLVTGSGVRAGMLICYESIFPELAQARVEARANLLVNISNDAWFGRSSAPFQHLDLTVLRAVEQGRSIARCTNTGVSAFVGPRGRILAATPLFTATVLSRADLPLCEGQTPFHRMAGYLAWLPFALLALCGLAALTALKA
ncbi:apolipoprotein N-acyltransferase [Desulfocurvus sp. DL9XJH121]